MHTYQINLEYNKVQALQFLYAKISLCGLGIDFYGPS